MNDLASLTGTLLNLDSIKGSLKIEIHFKVLGLFESGKTVRKDFSFTGYLHALYTRLRVAIRKRFISNPSC